jgi:tellurite resistance protein TerA
MEVLHKGANTVLTDRGEVWVEVRWHSAHTHLNIVCLAIDATGQVPAEDWCLFYNHRQAPGGSIELISEAAKKTRFRLWLDRLPAQIQKCVFAGIVDNGDFQQALGTTFTAIVQQHGRHVHFTLREAGQEQALIFAELYRYQATWKVRAVGQGFAGGLDALATHFGARISNIQVNPSTTEKVKPTNQPPTPPQKSTTSPPPAPANHTPKNRAAKKQRPKWTVKQLIMIVSLIAIISIALVSVLSPAWFFRMQGFTTSLLADALQTTPSIPFTNTKKDCSSEQTLFARYHELGQQYIKILETVDDSNQLLATMREKLLSLTTTCAQTLIDQNRDAIIQLEALPVQRWMDEAIQLNVCAGKLIKQLELALDSESRPVVIQRLLQDADRARNLESDLTNISRDLAYLNNKVQRLIIGYHDNLDACRR